MMSDHGAHVLLTTSLRMAIDTLEAFVHRLRDATRDVVRFVRGLHRMCLHLQGEVWALCQDVSWDGPKCPSFSEGSTSCVPHESP